MTLYGKPSADGHITSGMTAYVTYLPTPPSDTATASTAHI